MLPVLRIVLLFCSVPQSPSACVGRQWNHMLYPHFVICEAFIPDWNGIPHTLCKGKGRRRMILLILLCYLYDKSGIWFFPKGVCEKSYKLYRKLSWKPCGPPSSDECILGSWCCALLLEQEQPFSDLLRSGPLHTQNNLKSALVYVGYISSCLPYSKLKQKFLKY